MKLAVAVFLFASSALAQDSGIIVTAEPAQGITLFSTRPESVKVHGRGLGAIMNTHEFKMYPFAAQSADSTTAGLRIKIASSWGNFSEAGLLVVVDGKQIYHQTHLWDAGNKFNVLTGAGQVTTIESVEIVSALSSAHEAYLTVLLLGRDAPYDHISFRFSPEQLADCQRIAKKYATLVATQ